MLNIKILSNRIFVTFRSGKRLSFKIHFNGSLASLPAGKIKKIILQFDQSFPDPNPDFRPLSLVSRWTTYRNY